MIRSISPCGALLEVFAPAATRYWLRVFPAVTSEVSRWEALARRIPDPTLRALATEALRSERGNLEGAAAFAAFIPHGQRQGVVSALVAFQAAYDYADALSEQPNLDPTANACRLHSALVAALNSRAARRDYYSHHSHRDDGGYLCALVERCSKAVDSLPSYSAVASFAQRAARRMAAFQSLNLSERQGGRGGLERWVSHHVPVTAGFLWWETAAAAGSSLVVFALIAAAASPNVEERHAKALTQAYFPWIGALHILLDSLTDQAEDARGGIRSFLDYYESPEHAASRLHAIAVGAVRRAKALPCGPQHSLILAAMISFYLSATDSRCPHASLVRPRLLKAMGGLAAPTMLTMRARHAASQLKRSLRVSARPGRVRPSIGQVRLRRARRARAHGCGEAPRG